MKVKVTDADMKAAYLRLHFQGWERLCKMARELAAERLLTENSDRTRRLIEANDESPKTLADWDAYMKRQAEIDRLFKEHDELCDIAFPRVTTEGTEGAAR